jgi:hypothetical protein
LLFNGYLNETSGIVPGDSFGKGFGIVHGQF